MPKISSREKITNYLDGQSDGVKWYFTLLPELLDNISTPEPALYYCFQRIESAQRVGLYCLLMRAYRTDSKLAWGAVDRLDITRRNFLDFYEAVAGHKLPPTLRATIEPAEKVRDRIIHGRQESKASVHNAILSCLKFADTLNDAFFVGVGFRPIGPLKGVTGMKGKPQLDQKISRAVLRGLGFPV